MHNDVIKNHYAVSSTIQNTKFNFEQLKKKTPIKARRRRRVSRFQADFKASFQYISDAVSLMKLVIFKSWYVLFSIFLNFQCVFSDMFFVFSQQIRSSHFRKHNIQITNGKVFIQFCFRIGLC